MRARNLPIVAILGILCACDLTVGSTSPPLPAPLWSPEEAARGFVAAAASVEPVAESECRKWTQDLNCDFRIVIDSRRNQPPNAFQSVDPDGRPVITFTIALIATTGSTDEIAFILSHEAAHHILGHLEIQRRNAEAGAAIFGGLATESGASPSDIRRAVRLGAQIGARSFSKDFELEADRLGTIIAFQAGYDPIKGIAFFNRIPDPGDEFLGTHPPNAERIDMVRRTTATLGRAKTTG